MMKANGNQPYKLVVNDALCLHCKRCLASANCRGNAFIRFDPDDSPFIDMSRCWGCLTCLALCPVGAITREDYGQPEKA